MKYVFKKAVCFALLLCLFPLHSLADGAVIRFDRKGQWLDENRSISYTLLEAQKDAYAPAVSKINQTILDVAHIPEYENLLSAVQPGGTGLIFRESRMVYWADRLFTEGKGYISLLLEAEGKMLQGRPSHRYYPFVFNVETGNRVTFDEVFADPEGAKAYIESYLTNVIEPQLSTYLENNQLFPVPYENFGFSHSGHIIFYYPNDQLSFLSGTSGAVAFRYSELWDYLDTSENGVAMQMLKGSPYDLQYTPALSGEKLIHALSRKPEALPALDYIAPKLGLPMEAILANYDISVDSGFYPGGAYFETETPALLGTYLITDENETYVSGLLTSRIDMYGIETGKTTLEEARNLLGTPAAEMDFPEAAAQMYLVCPGRMLAYSYTPDSPIHCGETGKDANAVSLTLYADESGIVQYVKLSLE